MPDTIETQEPVDPIAFRNALGAFVTGVTIVTTRDQEGRPVGLTANSFNSVSLDPPMVLWSLGLNSGSLAAFRDTKWWAVHILGSEQEALSGRFAKRGADKFTGLAFTEGPGGIPLIEGCAARFVCRTAFEYEGGDHAIFVGEVTGFERGAQTPLAFHQGRYARVLSPEAVTPEPLSDDGQFGRRFLGHYFGRVHYELFNDIRREYRRRGLNGRDYTILTILGYTALDKLGTEEGPSMHEVIERAARAGVEISRQSVEGLAEKGLLVMQADKSTLTPAGRQIVVELMAVAQASQARIEGRLAAGEITMLKHLIDRIIETAPHPSNPVD